MSAARIRILRLIVTDLRDAAAGLTIVARDQTFRQSDYQEGGTVATFEQMSEQLEQYAETLSERLVQRVKP